MLWEWESFENTITSDRCRIEEYGPLHTPVSEFSIKRDKDFQIILETFSPLEAKAKRVERPAGRIYTADEKVKLVDYKGIEVVLNGVVPEGHTAILDRNAGIKEKLSISFVEMVPSEAKVEYTIDWLLNVKNKHALWTDKLKHVTQTVKTLSIGGSEIGEIRLFGEDKYTQFNRCVKFLIDGVEVYLCKSTIENKSDFNKGFLIYAGDLSADTRRRIRECISFSLGTYLVHLGDSKFDKDCKLVSFRARSAFKYDKKIFQMTDKPPAFVFEANDSNVINGKLLNKMVNALYKSYDCISFRSLSWMYWHALCAPAHSAPAHWGALIEALQTKYIEQQSNISTKLLASATWKNLKKKLNDVLENMDIENEVKAIVTNKIGDINKAPQGVILERLFNDLNLQLGDVEKKAWRQRNNAAHGRQAEEGDSTLLIKDITLLKIRFHRMLLSITKAADSYYDDYTEGYMFRKLSEAIS